MRYTILFFLLAALLYGCNGGNNGSKSQTDYRHTDSILKNMRSVDTLRMFVNTFHASHDDRGEVIAMRELGKRLREESKFSEAIEIHKNGLKLAESIKDTNNIIHILNQLGTSYRRIGIMDEAALYHYKALSYSDVYGDPESKKTLKNRVTSLNGIGNAMKVMGNDAAADSIFRQALEGERKLDSKLGMAINYANLGTLFERKKQFDSAMVYYGESMRLNSEVKSKLGVSLCHTHFGQVYEKRQMIDSAIVQYNLAYDVIKGDRDLWHILASTLALARVYIIKGSMDKAWDLLCDAEKTAEEINSLRHLAQVSKLKYQWFEKKGDNAKALEYYIRNRKFEDSLNNEENTSRIQNLRVDYERQSKQYEINLLENELTHQKLESTRILIAVTFVAIVLLVIWIITLMRGRRQLKKANDEIAEAYQQTKKALEVKTAFMKSMKHEIRTPLNGIMGFSQLLSSMYTADEQAHQMTEVIEKQSMLLAKIIDDILEIADADTVKPKIENCAIDEIVESSMATARQVVNADVAFAYKPFSTGVVISTDSHILQTILVKVLDNAAKFTKQGSITVLTKQIEHGISFIVEDTGSGIPADKTETVFDQFTKLDEFSQGTGMGLTLCRTIIQKLNGKIFVDTSYSGGCRMIIEIPQQ
ncbi:MAG: tetratricopeptide repeat-containing sensor histidine kinase [Prevotella sp.]|nr:tetratricopeptide repeat-containing sensor histidine kinase [Prevotellaceae bacterium]MDY4629778.1 tetratricopeptide repeat-containing sensor histidine kinase [Prevotella sp.]MDY5210045.1 tetratricopeptide repeat-containing sensor histidine kinase [Prevotella sp.]